MTGLTGWHALEEKRWHLWCQARDIAERAAHEKRNLTEEEDREFCLLNAELDQLTAEQGELRRPPLTAKARAELIGLRLVERGADDLWDDGGQSEQRQEGA